eukprot:TRINITY_DN39570_c0_g1_i1.p1 TRINITY_DN39570_c0_g1~~TRINITY_DN39570_c0_g1_i1.p1  ORF type:complete len:378 (+),score=39.46 TRINITY_DN39570_c0_g1_i1:139-1272(+)
MFQSNMSRLQFGFCGVLVVSLCVLLLPPLDDLVSEEDFLARGSVTTFPAQPSTAAAAPMPQLEPLPAESQLAADSASGAAAQRHDPLLLLARRIHALHGVVLLQFLTEGFVTMTRSWICNILIVMPKSSMLLEKTLFVAADTPSYDALSGLRDSSGQPLNVVLEQSGEGGSFAYGQVGYFKLMFQRTRMLLSLLEHGIDFWLIESDAVWLSDPQPFWLNSTHSPGVQEADFVLCSDKLPDKPKRMMGGFQLSRARPAAIKVWQTVEQKLQGIQDDWRAKGFTDYTNVKNEGNEQTMLATLIRTTASLKVHWVDAELFPPGTWYRRDSRGKPGAGYNKTPVVIQNNWITGIDKKINRAKVHGHWFLSADDTTCVVRKK